MEYHENVVRMMDLAVCELDGRFNYVNSILLIIEYRVRKLVALILSAKAVTEQEKLGMHRLCPPDCFDSSSAFEAWASNALCSWTPKWASSDFMQLFGDEWRRCLTRSLVAILTLRCLSGGSAKINLNELQSIVYRSSASPAVARSMILDAASRVLSNDDLKVLPCKSLAEWLLDPDRALTLSYYCHKFKVSMTEAQSELVILGERGWLREEEPGPRGSFRLDLYNVVDVLVSPPERSGGG